MLSNRAAEESGAVAKSAPRSFLMGMRGEAKIKTLEVGDLKAKDISVIVLDHPTLKALGGFLGRPLDGIIGFTFFARYRTTIDYQARRMTLEPVDFTVRDLFKELPDRLAGPQDCQASGPGPERPLGPDPGRPGRRGPPASRSRPSAPALPPTSPASSPATSSPPSTAGGPATPPTPTPPPTAPPPVRRFEAVVLRDGKELKLQVRPVGGI